MSTKAQLTEILKSGDTKLINELLTLAAQLPPSFVDDSFPEQAAFINDPYRFLLLFGTRRSGKSHAIGRKLLKTAWERPNTVLVYIALTREESKNILWKPVLEDLNYKLGLQAKMNHSDLTMTLPNGSIIRLMGVDQNDEEKRKLYGQRFSGVAIDEAALFKTDLKELIDSVLLPSLNDLQGWLVVGGMARSEAIRGYFYYLTKDQDSQNPGTWTIFDNVAPPEERSNGRTWYKGHRFSAWQNPYMVESWKKDVELAIQQNPYIVETRAFIEDYLGRWAPQSPNLVARFSPERNITKELPILNHWNRYLGIDLGWDDPTAFTVGYWSHSHTKLYIVHTEKASNLTVPDVVQAIKRLEVEWGPFDRKIVDGANKQVIESIRPHLQVALQPAEKSEKWAHIQVMNGDFLTGTLQLVPSAKGNHVGNTKITGSVSPLIQELNTIEKDRSSDIPKIREGQDDHIFDSLTYLWREAMKYLRPEIEKIQKPKQFSQAWADQEKEKHFRNIRLQNQGNPNARY